MQSGRLASTFWSKLSSGIISDPSLFLPQTISQKLQSSSITNSTLRKIKSRFGAPTKNTAEDLLLNTYIRFAMAIQTRDEIELASVTSASLFSTLSQSMAQPLYLPFTIYTSFDGAKLLAARQYSNQDNAPSHRSWFQLYFHLNALYDGEHKEQFLVVERREADNDAEKDAWRITYLQDIDLKAKA